MCTLKTHAIILFSLHDEQEEKKNLQATIDLYAPERDQLKSSLTNLEFRLAEKEEECSSLRNAITALEEATSCHSKYSTSSHEELANQQVMRFP